MQSLPKITLDTFNGNPLQWTDWYQKFIYTIDKTFISDTHKITYLQGLVGGTAKDAIRGFSCNGSFYEEALEELKRRFGRPELIVRSYFENLCKQPPLINMKPYTYIKFSSFINAMVRTFESLDYTTDLESSNNLHLALNHLPHFDLFKWNQYIQSKKILKPTLKTFNEWLRSLADTYEMMPQVNQKPPTPNFVDTSETPKRFSSTFTDLQPSRKTTFQCILCTEQHALHKCPIFEQKTALERQQIVRDNRRCFNCLSPNHSSNTCPSSSTCRVDQCNGRHHSMLHYRPRVQTSSSSQQSDNRYGSKQTSKQTNGKTQQVILQVLPVVLHHGTKTITTNALIDTASSFTILLNKTAEKLSPTIKKHEIVTLDGIHTTTDITCKLADIRISPMNLSNTFDLTDVYITDPVNLQTISAPRAHIAKSFTHLTGLDLPTLPNAEVTMILGADAFDLIASREIISGHKNEPIASRCKLGWTITGQNEQSNTTHKSVFFCNSCVDRDNDLFTSITNWWKLEDDIPITVPLLSGEDQKALDTLESTYRLDSDGRIELGKIWKDDTELPNNQILAEKHLDSLLRRLDKTPELKEKYSQGITDDLQEGYIREVPPEKFKDTKWLIPHHGVVNENKPGKIRHVSNAASKFNKTSLNDMLLRGPNLLGNLLGILFRFREHDIAISADIEGMFIQVGVREKDRRYIRFLWKTNRREKARVFEYLRHIFGTRDSPTCAIFALIHAARNTLLEFPDLVNVVKLYFYMDDYLQSLMTLDEAITMFTKLRDCLGRAKFNLTKWLRNSKDILETIPPELLAKPVADLFAPGNTERVLGIHRNLSADTLTFKVPRHHLASTNTQRSLLMYVATFYDPSGMVAPLTIRIKIMLPHIWKDGQNWDKEIERDKIDPVMKWATELQTFQLPTIPRQYHTTQQQPIVQLHIFCDASQDATAVVAYYRFIANDSISTSFIIGKTRVAPLKQQTIPRFELLAAVYSTRFRTLIASQTTYPIHKVFHWSDSSAVIGWIRNTHEKHKMFIANRLGEIADTTSKTEWHHVPGADNPADDGIRGPSASSLTSQTRWLQGAPFLQLPDTEWPANPINAVTLISHARPRIPFPTYDFNYRDKSTWPSLHKFATVFYKLFHILRRSPISLHDLHSKVTRQLLRLSSYESFPIDIQRLLKTDHLSPKSKLIQLSPYVDENGCLRSASRLKYAPVSISTSSPLIPDGKHPIVRLFVEHQHRIHGHVGVEHLRNILQQKYWILKCRSLSKTITHQCFDCRRQRALHSQPQMANLPSFRFSAKPFTFKRIGIDFFGSFTVFEGKRLAKRYGCLITCLVTRAVHIESCHDLSTDSCLFALRRFISRRDEPHLIISDNGTNFVGASNVLKKARKTLADAQSHLQHHEIAWHFNPPGAPHFGGVWERLIGMAKIIFFTIASSQRLNCEVFTTLLTEVESILNSRPLTDVSNDIRDTEALTPAHFLFAHTNATCSSPTAFKRLHQQSKEILEQFWKRLLKEYLPTLRPRRKWPVSQDSLKCGDLVWILETNTPRGIWPIGRIIQEFKGPDNISRSFTVKTDINEVHKPAIALCPILPDQ